MCIRSSRNYTLCLFVASLEILHTAACHLPRLLGRLSFLSLRKLDFCAATIEAVVACIVVGTQPNTTQSTIDALTAMLMEVHLPRPPRTTVKVSVDDQLLATMGWIQFSLLLHPWNGRVLTCINAFERGSMTATTRPDSRPLPVYPHVAHTRNPLIFDTNTFFSFEIHVYYRTTSTTDLLGLGR